MPTVATKKNIRKGWLNPYNFNKNTLFDEDYEEPTFLSFKLEFGNWGASVNDEEADKIIWEAQDIKYQTADDLPMGLFNPNFTIPSTGTKSKLSSVSHYSAVEYLYRRNEDTRAQWLQAFIKGWYDLQKNYQFYFQEISGLNSLFTVDTTKGIRLEDGGTKITIKCLEDSIDQRIRYLLTLYRKAAWDENWQRWILPDIYRYFHMYIYISENRLFHLPKNLIKTKNNPDVVVGTNDNTDTSSYVNTGDLNNISILTQVAENITADNYAEMQVTGDLATKLGITAKNNTLNSGKSLVLTALNGFAPVAVFDCGPCEFDINTAGAFNDSYTINQENMHEMSFDVIVKNVHFYEKNPLMWRLGSTDKENKSGGIIYVKDLYNTTERKAYENIIKSFPGYIDQHYYNNDVNLQFLTNSSGNNNTSGDHYKAVQNMLSLYSALKEEYDKIAFSEATQWDSSTGKYTGKSDSFKKIFEALYTEMKSNRETSEKLLGVSGLSLGEQNSAYSGLNEDLQKLYTNLRNVYTSLQNNQEYLDAIYEQTEGDRSWATDLDGLHYTEMEMADLYAWIPRQNLIWPDLYDFIGDQNFVWPDLRSYIPDQDMTGIDMEAIVIHQDMIPMDNEPIEIPEQSLVEIPQPRDRSWATEFDGWNPENDSDNDLAGKKPYYRGTDPDVQLKNVGIQQPKDRSYATSFDGWNKRDVGGSDRNPDMTFVNDNISIPDQELIPLDLESEIGKQNLVPLTPDDKLKLNITGGTLYYDDEQKQHIRNVSLDDTTVDTEIVPISPDTSAYNIEMNMVPMDMFYEKPSMEMTPMEYEKYEEPGILDFNINNSNVERELGEIEMLDIHPDRSKYTKPEIKDISIQRHMNIPGMEMTSMEYSDVKKPEIQDVTVELSTNTPSMDMTNMIYEEPEDPEIKDVTVDLSSYQVPNISNVSVDLSEYDKPGIKDIEVEQTEYKSPAISNTALKNDYTAPSINPVTVELNEYETPEIKPINLEEPQKQEVKIKPVTIHKNISTGPVNMTSVNYDQVPDPKMKDVVLEKRKYTFTGDLTSMEYSEPKKPKMKDVMVESPVKQQKKIADVHPEKAVKKEKKIKRVTIDKSSRPSSKIKNVTLEEPDKRSNTELLRGIFELEKENKKLVREINELREQILKSKMVTVVQPDDKSWATELDGWNRKNDSDSDDMIGIKDAKSKPQKGNKKIQGPKLTL